MANLLKLAKAVTPQVLLTWRAGGGIINVSKLQRGHSQSR